MIWLWGLAYNNECYEYELENAYSGPSRRIDKDEEEDTLNDAKYDRDFDFAKHKKKLQDKKKQMMAAAKEAKLKKLKEKKINAVQP